MKKGRKKNSYKSKQAYKIMCSILWKCTVMTKTAYVLDWVNPCSLYDHSEDKFHKHYCLHKHCFLPYYTSQEESVMYICQQKFKMSDCFSVFIIAKIFFCL